MPANPAPPAVQLRALRMLDCVRAGTYLAGWQISATEATLDALVKRKWAIRDGTKYGLTDAGLAALARAEGKHGPT